MVEMEPPTSGGTDWADGCASIAPISPIADTEPEMGGRSGLPWLVWQGGHGAAVSGGEGGEGRLFFRVGVRFVALGAMPGAQGPICRCRRRCPGPVDDLFESGPRCDAMRCDGSAGDGRMDGRTAGEASPSVFVLCCAVLFCSVLFCAPIVQCSTPLCRACSAPRCAPAVAWCLFVARSARAGARRRRRSGRSWSWRGVDSCRRSPPSSRRWPGRKAIPSP